MTYDHRLPPELEAKITQASARTKKTKPFPFDPDPYVAPAPASIPRRQWLYGKYYMRGVVTASLGAPGRLKSTMAMTDITSMTTGLDLMNGKQPLECGPLHGAYLNGEENQDELDRRFAGICQHYELAPEQYQGRLWIISTRDNPVRLAVPGKGGTAIIAEDVVAALNAWCDRRKIDALIMDPLVSFHRVRENDPGDMDLLYKEGFGRIAGKTRSVDLPIHPRKASPGAISTTMDDLRGTGAQEGAIRAARIFNFMTQAEAEQFGIAEDRRRLYVRIDGGKNNPGPIATAHWVTIEVENLPNGDAVAVASPWKPQNPFDGVTAADMQRCRNLAQGGAYRADSQSKEWFGYAISEMLQIDVKAGQKNAKCDLARIKQLIKTWRSNKVLDVEERLDGNRHMREYIIPGPFNNEPHPNGADDERLDF